MLFDPQRGGIYANYLQQPLPHSVYDYQMLHALLFYTANGACFDFVTSPSATGWWTYYHFQPYAPAYSMEIGLPALHITNCMLTLICLFPIGPTPVSFPNNIRYATHTDFIPFPFHTC